MKAYFIVVKYESGKKEFCYLDGCPVGDTQITFNREEAERIMARMMDIHGPQGIEYELHEVIV